MIIIVIIIIIISSSITITTISIIIITTIIIIILIILIILIPILIVIVIIIVMVIAIVILITGASAAATAMETTQETQQPKKNSTGLNLTGLPTSLGSTGGLLQWIWSYVTAAAVSALSGSTVSIDCHGDRRTEFQGRLETGQIDRLQLLAQMSLTRYEIGKLESIS